MLLFFYIFLFCLKYCPNLPLVFGYMLKKKDCLFYGVYTLGCKFYPALGYVFRRDNQYIRGIDLSDIICRDFLRNRLGGNTVFARRFGSFCGRSFLRNRFFEHSIGVDYSDCGGSSRRYGKLLDWKKSA